MFCSKIGEVGRSLPHRTGLKAQGHQVRVGPRTHEQIGISKPEPLSIHRFEAMRFNSERVHRRGVHVSGCSHTPMHRSVQQATTFNLHMTACLDGPAVERSFSSAQKLTRACVELGLKKDEAV